MANLLSTYEIKGKTIKNRLVFPPCVCFGYGDETGIASRQSIDHYKIMAEGGVGLIVVEATCISPDAKLCVDQLGIWDDKHIEGLSKIVDVIHAENTPVLLQIHHGGYKTKPEWVPNPENIFTSSPYKMPDGTIVRGATKEEIKIAISQFAKAAERAAKAGFDGVEIHGAHDYLISQFLSADMNKRDDEYGKTRELFALQVVEAVKNAVPDDFIIGMRFGASDDSMADGIRVAKLLEEAGVDILNVSSGHTRVQPEDMEIINDEYNWITQLGMNIKKHVNIPVICVFGIKNPEVAEKIVKDGLCDFAASAKGLLADPYWIKRLEKSEPIFPCLECKKCQFYTDGSHCPNRKKITVG